MAGGAEGRTVAGGVVGIDGAGGGLVVRIEGADDIEPEELAGIASEPPPESDVSLVVSQYLAAVLIRASAAMRKTPLVAT
jgi:hypothetical protein